MKISKKYKHILDLYKYFTECKDNLDFSDQSAVDMFMFETHGIGNLQSGVFSSGITNGYAVGKRMMDITTSMWMEDIKRGILSKWELYIDIPEDYHWWLNRLFKVK